MLFNTFIELFNPYALGASLPGFIIACPAAVDVAVRRLNCERASGAEPKRARDSAFFCLRWGKSGKARFVNFARSVLTRSAGLSTLPPRMSLRITTTGSFAMAAILIVLPFAAAQEAPQETSACSHRQARI